MKERHAVISREKEQEEKEERLGVTVHTTIITGMRTTVKMEEWKRKDRQSTAEERLQKNK